MLAKLNLRVRILGIVAALTGLCLIGGLVSFWFTLQMNGFITSIIDRNLIVMQAIEELDSSLVMQKGYLTYFFQDGDEKWLAELGNRGRDFNRLLGQARVIIDDQAETEVLGRIESLYLELSFLRNRVVALYKEGRRQEGYQLHQEARRLFFQIRDQSGNLKKAHWDSIIRARSELLTNARRLATLSLTGVGVAVVLGALLALVLVRQVLRPIHRLARKALTIDSPVPERLTDVQALAKGVDLLMEDVDQVQSQLRVSQKHLIEASKLASVGRLAAGVAHSIRNPLTSVKMRLFSLEGNLSANPDLQDDFRVISHEIRHIDNIVRNFLEFSRRPKLRMEPVSPSEVVDMALTLLSHRLESYGVEVELERDGPLPETEADPEQLREVLVNLMVNACEATVPDPERPAGGGRITIAESREAHPELGQALVIRISDNGPGMPDEVKERVFEPFFTTKGEGTGLGLSIATRIIGEHGGHLTAESEPGRGAVMVIALPEAGCGVNGDDVARTGEKPWTGS